MRSRSRYHLPNMAPKFQDKITIFWKILLSFDILKEDSDTKKTPPDIKLEGCPESLGAMLSNVALPTY